jgi:uncharacterized SAM-binding protein YcdF (DUF218 family)
MLARPSESRLRNQMETDEAAHRNVGSGGSSLKPESSSGRRRVNWLTQLRLIRRCEIWCPTWLGSFVMVTLFVIPAAWWFSYGESFLSLNQRLEPEVLVVEGWIGIDGVRAAQAEFERYGYRYIVATGDLHSDAWREDHWSLAEMTARELIQLGVPENKIIVAPAAETRTQRTFQSAVAVWRALRAKGIRPRNLNVFTQGPHARRSRLIFAKVEGPETQVGVVAWAPSGYEAAPWWCSTERAKALLTETSGYLFEVFLNSGRSSSSPSDVRLPASVQQSS